MNLSAETTDFLNLVFGQQLTEGFAQRLGYSSPLQVTIDPGSEMGMTPAALSFVVRSAMRRGIGEVPCGWSLEPCKDEVHMLYIWTMDGVGDELEKALDAELN
jgi:hypothetical protein